MTLGKKSKKREGNAGFFGNGSDCFLRGGVRNDMIRLK